MKLDTIELLFGDARNMGGPVPKTVNTNIAILSAAAEKNNKLTLDFEYAATYVPDGSHIRLGGKAVFVGPEAKKAAAEWKKDGRITGEHGELIMNAINYASSVNGVLIARAFNLTAPVVLAQLEFRGKK